MDAQRQRAAIEQLKAENNRLQRLLLQGQAADNHSPEQVTWLTNQIECFRKKTVQEDELAQQIQRELDGIKKQLQRQPCTSSPTAHNCPGKVSSSLTDAKKQVILQQRLDHQSRQLNVLKASNHSRQQAVDGLCKRIQATEQAVHQLDKQLCSVQAELTSVTSLNAAVQESQQQVAQLCKLLHSQDDAEHLALSTVAKQVSQLKQSSYSQVAGVATDPAAVCMLYCTEEEAADVLDRLCCFLEQHGIFCQPTACTPSADTGIAGADVHSSDPCTAQIRHHWLLLKLEELRAQNFRLFQHCSISNWLQQEQHASAGSSTVAHTLTSYEVQHAWASADDSHVAAACSSLS